MASIMDVAKVAKVAPSTVSLVVNKRPNVSTKLRRRVQRAIDRVGYRSRAERRRASHKPLHLAVVYTPYAIVHKSMTSLCRMFMRGIHHELTQADRLSHMETLLAGDTAQVDPLFAEAVKAGEFNGLFLISGYPPTPHLQMALDAGLPVVTINHRPQTHEFSCISIDYRGAGRLVGRRLKALGHERIATLGDYPDKWNTREFTAGLGDGLGAAVVGDALALHCPFEHFDVDTAARFCRQMIDAGVTALATGDHYAIECVNTFERMGVDVPGRMSVIGFDDLGLTSDKGLKLTSVGCPQMAIGRMAAKVMLKLIKPNGLFGQINATIRTHIVGGQTLAEAPMPPERPRNHEITGR